MIDLVDRHIDVPAASEADPTAETARVMSSVTAESRAMPTSDDDELVKTFFEQGTFADERWKPRKERDRDKDRKRP